MNYPIVVRDNTLPTIIKDPLINEDTLQHIHALLLQYKTIDNYKKDETLNCFLQCLIFGLIGVPLIVLITVGLLAM